MKTMWKNFGISKSEALKLNVIDFLNNVSFGIAERDYENMIIERQMKKSNGRARLKKR